MSEFRDKLLEINLRIDAMGGYDPSAVFSADADSADAIEQLMLAQVHIRTAYSMMLRLWEKYQLPENISIADASIEENRLKKARSSLLEYSLRALDRYDWELEGIIDNVADSEDGEPDYILELLENYEETGEYGMR